MYIRNVFKKCVERIDSGFNYAVILELNNLVNISTNEPIGSTILVSSYIPPQYSNIYDDELNGIEILREKLVDLKMRFPDHNLLVAGDLNARVGSLYDYLPDDNVDHIPNVNWYEPSNFNIPRNSKDTSTNEFGDHLSVMCIELEIYILNGRIDGDLNGEFTNITENGKSVVDYVLADQTIINVVKSFCVSDIAEANHLPLQCVLGVKFDQSEELVNAQNALHVSLSNIPKFKWKNNLRSDFLNTLSDADSLASFNSVLNLADNSVDEAVKMFVDVIHKAAEPMAVHTKNRKTFIQPKWWCPNCDILKTRKYNCLKRFKLTNSEADLYNYRNARREFKNLCKMKKLEWKNHLRERLIESRSNPTEFWKTVKNSIRQHFQISELITPVEWFKYFEQLLNQNVTIDEEFADHVKTFTESHDSHCGVCAGHEQGSAETQELNGVISEEEILKSIMDMSNGKAAGIDGVVVEMLKCSTHITLPYLCHLYNSILSTGQFPKQWCKAVLAPLHKKGTMSDPNNYRGIALLSVLGKVFTKILNNRIVHWLETGDLQIEEQAGFRKGYSTIDNIFILQSLIQKYCSRSRGRFYTIYVDFSKAFDTVPHALLFYQLLTKGMHGRVLQVLKSMYAQLESCVRTPGGITEFFKCTIGTRQGCMLSPCLFSLYVGELITMLDESRCRGTYVNDDAENIIALLFADDIVAGADTVGRLQHIINVIANFCKKWGLIVNLSKTKVMVFRGGGPLRQNEKWYFDGKLLEVVSAYKYLGSIFTPKLVWSQCQKTLALQAQKGLFLIRKFSYACEGLPVDIMFELFDKMISPILLYSSEIWGFEHANEIEKMHIKFCKQVLGVLLQVLRQL